MNQKMFLKYILFIIKKKDKTYKKNDLFYKEK